MARARTRRTTPQRRWNRIHLLFAVFAFWAVVIVVRLFSLQILQYDVYVALAEGQHELSEKLLPERGEIFASDTRVDALVPLAINKTYGWLYGVPREIDNPRSTAEQLAVILGFTEDKERIEDLVEKFSKENDPFEPIARKVSDELLAEIEERALPGIYSLNEKYRYYTEKAYASHLVGFLSMSDDAKKGQYGIEGYFDEELAGKPGQITTSRDAFGRWIAIGDATIEEAVDGSDIVLTIDANIQHHACKALDAYVQRFGAIGGAVVVMDPSTGAIRAMCGWPMFDPNTYNEVASIEAYQNPTVSFTYEPGSVFKAITMAAALDSGAVTPTTTYEDTGEEIINGYKIQNSDRLAHGVQTMTNVLEKSLNTGVIFAMRQTTPEVFARYIRAFGFGQKTAVSLGAEAAGNISSLDEKAEVFFATASFGQGLTVTPLQLASAFSTIANNGMRMKPRIIDSIVHPDGTKEVMQPQELGQVISDKTAKTLGAMLVSVVEVGHATLASVPGYYLAGKTGTAQKHNPDGRGYSTLTFASFGGFGLMDDPRFVISVMLDEPKVDWAASSAAPLFADIADYILRYYQIPPERAIE